MKRRGAEIFLDLTAGGVNYRKWANVIQGRSLELRSAFLCTMAKRSNERGAACALAFHNGVNLEATITNLSRDGFGGYAIYELPAASRGLRATDVKYDGEQPYTNKRYRDITVTTRPNVAADITVEPTTGAFELSGHRAKIIERWHGFESVAGCVGVLPLDLDSLRDGLVLYQQAPPKGTFEHHIVLYHSSHAPHTLGGMLALAKLRAIEHRIGVVVLAGEHHDALKTNRYKNIQRFREVAGVFGFNAEFLGGTWSTAGNSSTLGIPIRFFCDYLALLDWRSSDGSIVS